MILNNQEPEKGQILLYQTEDQGLRLECRFVGDTLWLSQTEICTLYGKAKATISEHISNVFKEGECDKDSVVRSYRTTAADGKPYNVISYLEFAELQAERGRLMKMADWSAKLDDFLRLSDYELLNHTGRISALQAKQKAALEFDAFQRVIDATPSQVDRDLEQAIKRLPKK